MKSSCWDPVSLNCEPWEMSLEFESELGNFWMVSSMFCLFQLRESFHVFLSNMFSMVVVVKWFHETSSKNQI